VFPQACGKLCGKLRFYGLELIANRPKLKGFSLAFSPQEMTFGSTISKKTILTEILSLGASPNECNFAEN
jgi:hypothetical protein